MSDDNSLTNYAPGKPLPFNHKYTLCPLDGKLCKACLALWLNRPAPKGTWRELQAEKLEARLRREQTEDEQFEAGHA